MKKFPLTFQQAYSLLCLTPGIIIQGENFDACNFIRMDPFGIVEFITISGESDYESRLPYLLSKSSSQQKYRIVGSVEELKKDL